MLFYNESFGEDSDGKRGLMVWYYEFENTAKEKEEIADGLYDDFLEGKREGGNVVMMCNPYTQEDMEIEVDIEDYLDLLIEKFDHDDTMVDNESLQKEIEELVFNRNLSIDYSPSVGDIFTVKDKDELFRLVEKHSNIYIFIGVENGEKLSFIYRKRHWRRGYFTGAINENLKRKINGK